MSLSVGLLHYTSPPVVGGVETVLRHHARLMADAGIAVRMISGRGGRPDPRADLVRLPTADTRHPAVRAAESSLHLGAWAPATELLAQEIADGLREATAGLDVVVAHNVCSLGLNLPLAVALHRLVEGGAIRGFIAWNHDIAATSPLRSPRLRPGFPWDLLRQPWPRTIAVTISQARRAELAAATGLSVETIRVVPNGVDRTAILGLSPATRRLVDALDLHAAGPVLFTPARLTPRKNLELAVGVLAELRRSGDDARLLVTGAPDPHDRHAALHRDALRDLGAAMGVASALHLLVDGPAAWRSDRVVADLYRFADVLFLPSRDEGFGLPILEAAACRLPVVCADIPALRELTGDEATHIDPDGGPVAAAQRVRERLRSGPAERLAARSRAGHDWRTIFETRIRPLLQEAASAR